jgi:hypothetical protein
MNVKGVAKQDQVYPAKQAQIWDEWHRIFGHLNMGSVKMLRDKDMVIRMSMDTSVEPCEGNLAIFMETPPWRSEWSWQGNSQYIIE